MKRTKMSGRIQTTLFKQTGLFFDEVNMRKSLLVFISVCIAIVFCSSCGKKQDDEPTKKADQSELAKISNQQEQTSKKTAKQNKPAIGNISDNPAFFSAANHAPANDTAKDIDSIIMPVLKKVFGDAKFVAESKAPETKVDGEVVENRITYVVRQLLVPQDGVALHAAFTAAGFKTSPRLGRKPTIWSHGATMSLFRSTSKRGYSFVINIDSDKQQIVVESYKLGSKSDRM
jgi:hypothetical protein